MSGINCRGLSCAPAGFGADVQNDGVLHLDGTSFIDILDGDPPS